MLLNRLVGLDDLVSGLNESWGSSDNGWCCGNSADSSNMMNGWGRISDSWLGIGYWNMVGEEGGGSWWANKDTSVGNGHNGAKNDLEKVEIKKFTQMFPKDFTVKTDCRLHSNTA